MRLKVNKIHSLSVLIFIIVFLFSLWSHPSFIPKTSPDSWGYINLAKDFNHKISEIRPFFFPLLIKFCMSLSEMYWKQILLIIQISLWVRILKSKYPKMRKLHDVDMVSEQGYLIPMSIYVYQIDFWYIFLRRNIDKYYPLISNNMDY